MPTDLPPDYKPQPPRADPPGSTTAVPTPQGEDSRDPMGTPRPVPGMPGPEGDVVDPPGWNEPAIAPGGPSGVPSPAGTPSF